MSNHRYFNKFHSGPKKGGDYTAFELVFDKSDCLMHEPIQCKPLEIEVTTNFEDAFRKFRALVQREKVISKVKEKRAYEKPSDRRRRKNSEYSRAKKQELALDQD